MRSLPDARLEDLTSLARGSDQVHVMAIMIQRTSAWDRILDQGGHTDRVAMVSYEQDNEGCE